MKVYNREPWLTSSGDAKRAPQLKQSARKWNLETWGRYLDWYESSCQEKLVRPGVYRKICEQVTQSVFEQLSQSGNYLSSQACETLLQELPFRQAKVLRLSFLEGRTQREIGTTLGISQTGVFQSRKRALARLRRVFPEANVITRQYMKGEMFISEKEEMPGLGESFWEKPPFQNARIPGRNDPKLHKETLERIEAPNIRDTLLALAEDEQRMLYLSRWCGQGASQIARELGMGVNVVEQISKAAMSRVVRKIIHLETGREAGGDSSCS
jgi:RNA polymerase sigma factor (sigma-70 family)